VDKFLKTFSCKSLMKRFDFSTKSFVICFRRDAIGSNVSESNVLNQANPPSNISIGKSFDEIAVE